MQSVPLTGCSVARENAGYSATNRRHHPRLPRRRVPRSGTASPSVRTAYRPHRLAEAAVPASFRPHRRLRRDRDAAHAGLLPRLRRSARAILPRRLRPLRRRAGVHPRNRPAALPQLRRDRACRHHPKQKLPRSSDMPLQLSQTLHRRHDCRYNQGNHYTVMQNLIQYQYESRFRMNRRSQFNAQNRQTSM